MTDHGPDALDAFSPPRVGSASPVVISLVSPALTQMTVTPIDNSPKLPFNLAQGLESDLESHSDASNPLHPNVSHPMTRVALGEKAGAENLPVHRTKRRKLGNQRDNTAESMEDLVDCSRNHFQPAEDESTTQKQKTRKPAKPSEKGQKSEKTANLRLRGKVKKASDTQVLVPIDKSAQDPSQKFASQHRADEENGGLHLEEATSRRDYWTPIKDTNSASIDLTGSPVSIQADKAQAKSKDFRELMSEFNFSRETSHEVEAGCQLVNDKPTTKQLLEFMPQNCRTSKSLDSESLDTGTSSTSEGNGKRKQTKKAKRSAKSKITTITSLTTGRYESSLAPEGDHIPSSLVDNMVESIQPAEKAPSNRKNTKPKSKKAIPGRAECYALLKPAPTMEALKTIENQALLFGTSSQLERESSPNVYGLEPELGRDEVKSNSIQNISSEPSTGMGVSRFSKSKNLWGASSRDLDGYLLNVDMIDLVDPTPKITPKPGDERQSNLSNKNTERNIPEESSLLGEQVNAKDVELPDCLAGEISTSDTMQNSFEYLNTTNSQDGPVDDSMPNYDQLSTPELAKKLASFGFRPIKKRERIIELLEKCWESKRKSCIEPTTKPAILSTPQVVIQPIPPNANSKFMDSDSAIKPSSVPPKGTRKPKKITSKEITNPARSSWSTAKNLKSSSKPTDNMPDSMGSQSYVQPEIIEIEDSTDENLLESSKQPRDYRGAHTLASRSASSHITPQISSAPSQTVPIQTRASAGTNEKEIVDLPDIFLQITNAVKAQPRIRSVNGVKQPTWHEKIVMYDPIWLDDLTLWLNVEGFKLIKEDREVHPYLVREWCESKGICCCFRNKK
ncbi:5'-flap endonuclease [Microsporum canis]|uniref:Structure-specific endonuclease subunit SLX4 n=1 Tax=Arthroderma otae (strain ATCC MYA-4605 / CBS 113480) TaxID=554155 RepID=SLX4_ARTOC|nr:conserved hypothetical protein [Microsporum canis CBS 113480]C5FSF3.1 RecName: Full=Structure-specific endonuclease subunit SLX4 [Microsporum canis CBS 113480]EEQ32806.1 conserved hypothetical protein [Microsporum canis CBS 113480]